VTLDDTGWPAKQLQRRRGRVTTVLCSHNPIDHMIGRPCIQIHGFSEEEKRHVRRYFGLKHVYPLAHERNILPILEHESLHCCCQSIEECDDGLDTVIGLIEVSRRKLGS
jgi:hypothetical protein